MSDRRLVTVSKYLSKHLRHDPQRLGLSLAPGGWVGVEDLLEAAAYDGFPISPEELGEVVRTSDKQRYSFDDTGMQIRANQGHSVPVDLQLDPTPPPAVLYHGTARQHVESILEKGLCRMSRHHVHLSADVPTAKRVGGRHGKPVVLTVDAAAMREAGLLFYRSANGVWLADGVPPAYLRVFGDC